MTKTVGQRGRTGSGTASSSSRWRISSTTISRAWRASRVRGGTPGELATDAEPEVFFARGLCNGDERLNITDAVFILRHLFSGGTEPSCLAACDANADEQLGIDDAVAFLNYLFTADGFMIPEPGPMGCAPAPAELCEVSTCVP